MRPRKFILPQAGTGGYGIRPYVFCGGRIPLAEAVPRVELSPFVESEIRRGAFYMRPRRFILPQAGTGGYGLRPYVFCGGVESPRRGRCPAWSFLPLLKARSVGAHSICARGSLPCRKRARADMESAPTFLKRQSTSTEAAPRVQFSPFVESEIRRGAFYMRPRRFILPPSQRRCHAWSCLPLLKAKSVGAHSICARGSLSYRKRARADMESAPTFLKRQSTSTEAAPRVQFSPFVESEIRRGAFYMRPRRFILPQAGTGGYGIRPYVFFVAGGEGRVFACCACKRIYLLLSRVPDKIRQFSQRCQ